MVAKFVYHIMGICTCRRYGRKYPSGEYLVEQMVLYTNRGLGTSWLKFRFNCPPEITVFELNTNHQNHLRKPDNKKIDC